MRTSSTRSRAPAAWISASSIPLPSSCANASASDSRGTRPSASYSRRRRIRWCCSAMLTSWKNSANARRTAPWRSRPSAATASRERLPRAAGARIAREGPDPLFVVEQLLALLLDEHAPEQVAEQAHVGAESGIGRHERSLEGQESAAAEATAAGNVKDPSRFDRRVGNPQEPGLTARDAALSQGHGLRHHCQRDRRGVRRPGNPRAGALRARDRRSRARVHQRASPGRAALAWAAPR